MKDYTNTSINEVLSLTLSANDSNRSRVLYDKLNFANFIMFNKLYETIILNTLTLYDYYYFLLSSIMLTLSPVVFQEL